MLEHRYAKTEAAMMLTAGLALAAKERKLSLREIGRRLGYRQPVVLSHMSSGRVPVPIDRALDIAEQVGIPGDQFLEAVVHQHHPLVEWELITGKSDPFVVALETAAGMSLGALGAEHQRVLREVVKDREPQERWLSVPEVAGLTLLRKIFPGMESGGLSQGDRDALLQIADLRETLDAGYSTGVRSLREPK